MSRDSTKRKRRPMIWRYRKAAPLALLTTLSIAIVLLCGCGKKEQAPEYPDRFEPMRSHIAGWLGRAAADLPVKKAESLKEIVDNWDSEKDNWQIISLRTKADYDSSGHVYNAQHLPWRRLADTCDVVLAPERKALLYCYTGHTAQIGSTVIGLLGYESYNLKFGMMDWNVGALAMDPWDMVADYEAGHIPHAINIHWKELADPANLAKLDPNKTVIVYCYTGPTAQIASTVLNILGYSAINMKYGMMDWNTDCVSTGVVWDGVAVYPVQLADYLK
jgi:rhodanese-related sulfurtransferase